MLLSNRTTADPRGVSPRVAPTTWVPFTTVRPRFTQAFPLVAGGVTRLGLTAGPSFGRAAAGEGSASSPRAATADSRHTVGLARVDAMIFAPCRCPWSGRVFTRARPDAGLPPTCTSTGADKHV